jgi:hypothetical protein
MSWLTLVVDDEEEEARNDDAPRAHYADAGGAREPSISGKG